MRRERERERERETERERERERDREREREEREIDGRGIRERSAEGGSTSYLRIFIVRRPVLVVPSPEICVCYCTCTYLATCKSRIMRLARGVARSHSESGTPCGVLVVVGLSGTLLQYLRRVPACMRILLLLEHGDGHVQ